MSDPWRRLAPTFGWLAPVLGAMLMAGCTADAGSDGWTVSVDTVGSMIQVTNAPPADGARPTVVAEEDFRIGTVSDAGPTSFGLVRSVAVLPDGRFAVADGQAQEVRLFDAQGAHLRTFGGEGAGPGELRGLQGVHVDHEGLLRVAEQGNARLSVFHPDSGFVTSFPLQLFSFTFGGPWRAVMDSTGRTFVDSSGQYGEGRFWNMVRVYDATMTQLDSIPYHDYTDESRSDDDPPGAWRIDLGSGWTYAQVPFYAQSHQVLTPAGELWTSAEGAGRAEVYRWRPSGDTVLALISHRTPAPVTPAERDSAMEEIRARLSERLSDPPGLDPARVPATKPPVYALSVDDRDRLWVRISDPAEDSTVYDIFTDEGRHAETVLLPFRIDRYVPPVVRGDTLWGVVTDDLDVQHVVRARIRPAAGVPAGG